MTLAPWGKSPTPLLPLWYRKMLCDLEVPDGLRAANPGVRTIGELDSFWEGSNRSTVEPACLRELVSLVCHVLPPRGFIVIPEEIDKSKVTAYPLRTRTANAVQRAYMINGQNPISVGDLLSVINFGTIPLIDLMCVVERATEMRLCLPVSDTRNRQVQKSISDAMTLQDEGLNASQSENIGDETCSSGDAKNTEVELWDHVIRSLKKLLNTAREFYGVKTVGDALKLNLASLASTLEIASSLDSVSIADLTDGTRLAHKILNGLNTALASMSTTEQTILEQRLYATQRLTQQEIGQLVDLSSEQTSQIEQEICEVTEQAIEEAIGQELRIAARLLGEQMGAVVAAQDFEHAVTRFFGQTELDAHSSDLPISILKNKLDYSYADGMYLNRCAVQIVRWLKIIAPQFSDDIGLINEDALNKLLRDGDTAHIDLTASRLDEDALRKLLRKEDWMKYLPVMTRCCGFYRVIGQLALRDTHKVRTKAALIKLGRPATKQEIALTAGLDLSRIGSQLSSMSSIARADKTRWGLKEWIDDIYEGIPAEILQRINEDGGVTTLDRLLYELPKLFGVSESSVRSCVGSPQFVLKDGCVSVADPSTIALRTLEDVIDGRTIDGKPYWTFKVEDRYFNGYSLVGLPPELARELGCPPNGRTRIPLTQPEGCRDLSVSWRLSSLAGASLGYLSDPLRQLGVLSGSHVRLIIKSPRAIELHDDAKCATPAGNSPKSAESLLERMKNRRKVI